MAVLFMTPSMLLFLFLQVSLKKGLALGAMAGI
jgi:ABC-type maltose transport system permease subunit